MRSPVQHPATRVRSCTRQTFPRQQLAEVCRPTCFTSSSKRHRVPQLRGSGTAEARPHPRPGQRLIQALPVPWCTELFQNCFECPVQHPATGVRTANGSFPPGRRAPFQASPRQGCVGKPASIVDPDGIVPSARNHCTNHRTHHHHLQKHLEHFVSTILPSKFAFHAGSTLDPHDHQPHTDVVFVVSTKCTLLL